MKCTTKWLLGQPVTIRVHLLVALSILALALPGRMPDSQAG